MVAIHLILQHASGFLIPSLPAFIQLGFMEVRWVDILDVVLVGLLIYQLYRLIRGSLAYEIFIGFLVVYLLSLLFRALDMQLISGIAAQFIGIGLLALIIIFQPEVRRFLLVIGRNSELRRYRILERFNLFRIKSFPEEGHSVNMGSLINSLMRMSREQTGALIVFSRSSRLEFFTQTGVAIDAILSGKLLEAIFHRNSPIHDGAVIVGSQRIVAAGCILPVSESTGLPRQLGLRHRAALGISEHSDAIALVISEELGRIAYARAGELHENLNEEQLKKLLTEWLNEQATGVPDLS